MKGLIVLYFFLAILFTFFYAYINPVSTFVNKSQAALTLSIVGLFLYPAQLQGIDIWINPHYKIIINHTCNGLIPILFLFASILAYPSASWHKVYWMIAGYVVFSLVNVWRILLVVYFVEQKGDQGNFYWSHDLLGNTILMATGLTLFTLFIKQEKIKILLS